MTQKFTEDELNGKIFLFRYFCDMDYDVSPHTII